LSAGTDLLLSSAGLQYWRHEWKFGHDHGGDTAQPAIRANGKCGNERGKQRIHGELEQRERCDGLSAGCFHEQRVPSFVSGYQDLDVGNVVTKAVSGLSAGTCQRTVKTSHLGSNQNQPV